MKRYYCIALLEELYDLQSLQLPVDDGPSSKSVIIKDFRNQIIAQLKSSAEQHKLLYKSQNKGFEHLFTKWSLEQPAASTVPAILDKAETQIQKTKAKQEEIKALVVQSQSMHELQVQIDEKLSNPSKKKLQWSEVKEARGKIAIKATEEIKLIQQKRIESERKDQ